MNREGGFAAALQQIYPAGSRADLGSAGDRFCRQAVEDFLLEVGDECVLTQQTCGKTVR